MLKLVANERDIDLIIGIIIFVEINLKYRIKDTANFFAFPICSL